MQSKLVGVLCIAVLCIILTLGLQPFHSPRNNIAWLRSVNGLSYGRNGTIQGSDVLRPENGVSGSFEVWVQPDRWTNATILAFYEPEIHRLIRLQQSVSDLKLEAEVQRDGSQATKASLYVRDAFGPSLREKEPIFITVTYNPDRARVYLDGVLAEDSARFRMPQGGFSGRIVVGDAPWQPDNFRGQIRGLAAYDAELTDAQVARHYLTWTKKGHPDITEKERNIALYLFDEGAGTVIHNRAAAGVDLYIPETYNVVDKMALEPFWQEFNVSWSYWKAALVNVVGFIPLGFVFYVYFRVARPIRRSILVTLAVGAATSLTIEVLQAFLPTRDSGTTDLITNTLGTYLGVLCYRDVYSIVTKRFPGLRWFLEPRTGGKVTEAVPEQNWKSPPRWTS